MWFLVLLVFCLVVILLIILVGVGCLVLIYCWEWWFCIWLIVILDILIKNVIVDLIGWVLGF